MSNKTVEQFKANWASYFHTIKQTLSTDNGQWAIKGFIDIYRNIYTISADTKVISKLIEIMLFPAINQFAVKYEYQMVLSAHQNHYPDITFITKDSKKIAFDLKSTYRKNETHVNGFTLGAFTGYFRNRTSEKNITFPYQDYAAHFVFGVIYSRQDTNDERSIYKLDELESITSVVADFEFLLQEKWRIATDRPGSGNTKNIGSITTIQDLLNGNGTFANHSKAIFDDYWMNYLTADMARQIDSVVSYHNLNEYFDWQKRI